MDVIWVLHTITVVCLILTVACLPVIAYYNRLTDHHLNRIKEIQAGRPDPGEPMTLGGFVRDQMATLKQGERRWREGSE